MKLNDRNLLTFINPGFTIYFITVSTPLLRTGNGNLIRTFHFKATGKGTKEEGLTLTTLLLMEEALSLPHQERSG